MANSKRKTILNYIRDTTLAAITTGNGYNSTPGIIKRGIKAIDSLPVSSFPVLFITTSRETRNNITKVTVRSLMRVEVEAYVKRSGDVDGLQADLDNIIEDVSEAFEQDRQLGGNCDYAEVQEITTDSGDLEPLAAAAFLIEIQWHAEGVAV